MGLALNDLAEVAISASQMGSFSHRNTRIGFP
jgi:hypothetical protein